MIIQEATTRDFAEVMYFYKLMCEELGNKAFLHNGNKGGFPSVAMVNSAIANGNLYIGKEDNKIIAAFILTHDAAPAYNDVNWRVNAAKNEVSILHALRVLPEYSGRGYAKQILAFVIDVAKNKGQKAIRLDCLDENAVPQKMYLAYGFVYIDTVEIFYEDIGEPRNFLLYEYGL